jgi:hypothetical protein
MPSVGRPPKGKAEAIGNAITSPKGEVVSPGGTDGVANAVTKPKVVDNVGIGNAITQPKGS